MSGKRDDRVLADGGRNQGSGQGDARQGGGAHQGTANQGTASQQGTGSRHGGPAGQAAGNTQGGGGQAGGHARQAGGQGGQAGGHARQGGRSPRSGGTGSPPGGGGGHAGGYGYGGPSPMARYAKIGLGVHLLFALGSALTIMLFSTFAPGGTATTTLPLSSGLGGGNQVLLASMLMAFGFAVVLGPLIAIGVGTYAGYTAHPGTSPPVLGAAANVVGAGITLLVTILLVVVLAQRGSAQGLGQLFGPMLGAVIGIGVVGAGAGFLGSWLRS